MKTEVHGKKKRWAKHLKHTPTSIFTRWWIYQRERFPIFMYGLLVAAFSFSMVSYSSLLRGYMGIPVGKALIVAFVTTFIFFLQLRIADEFKDFADDLRFRPYRPVPRGLISLRELAVVGVAGAIIQLLLALWLSPSLLPLLLGAWVYFGLMSREFFVSTWLKAHPITYMCTHMLFIPLITFYGTAFDWRVADIAPPNGLIFLLGVSLFNGFAVEIGRKIRAPQDEEAGVETYSYLWGRQRAVFAWYGTMLVTAICAFLAASNIGFALLEICLLISLLLVAAVIAVYFLRRTVAGSGKWIELVSGVWTLLIYLSLGVLPLTWQLATKGS